MFAVRDVQRHLASVRSAGRQIDGRRNRLAERPVLAVAHDAHDFRRPVAVPAGHHQPLAERIAVPELPRQRLVHDHDGRRALAIVPREVATAASGIRTASNQPGVSVLADDAQTAAFHGGCPRARRRTPRAPPAPAARPATCRPTGRRAIPAPAAEARRRSAAPASDPRLRSPRSTCASSTPAGSNPGFTSPMRARLRTNNPLHTSNTLQTATCPTISARRSR